MEKTTSDEELDEFIGWLERTPPYEQVGKVILDGSRLEIGIRLLAESHGETRVDSRKKKISQLVKFLQGAGCDQALLKRCEDSIERRNLVAHGTWMNLFQRGEAFVKPGRDTDGFRGKLISAGELEEWSEEIADLADLVQQMIDRKAASEK